MLPITQKKEINTSDSEIYAYTSKFISDELELIRDQKENIIQVADELDKAFKQVDRIKNLLKIVKKIDQTVLKKDIDEKTRKESKMINLIEDIKRLIKDQRYEDIDKYMNEVKHYGEEKRELSRDELNKLREIMSDLSELYQETAGLCRLYRVVYDNVKQVYDKCEHEYMTEKVEQDETSKAGHYTKYIY